MPEKALIGHELGCASILVEKGAVRAYAQAIGETDLVYFDVEAARKAGYRSLRVPPTFLFCLQGMVFNARDALNVAGMEITRVLHAEQGFDYHAPIFAGDTLTFRRKITDVFEKKGGMLKFLVMGTRVTDHHGLHVADMTTSIVQREI